MAFGSAFSSIAETKNWIDSWPSNPGSIYKDGKRTKTMTTSSLLPVALTTEMKDTLPRLTDVACKPDRALIFRLTYLTVKIYVRIVAVMASFALEVDLFWNANVEGIVG